LEELDTRNCLSGILKKWKGVPETSQLLPFSFSGTLSDTSSSSALDTRLSPMGIQQLAHNQPAEKQAEVIRWRRTGLLEIVG